METEKRTWAFDQAAGALPQRLRRLALTLPPGERAWAEELRLRAGRPLSVVFSSGEQSLGGPPVEPRELEQLLELATRASVHAALPQLRRGFLTIEGGHRIGLCGTAVMREGEIVQLRNLSSASVRIARQVKGAADGLLPRLCQGGRLTDPLILAPPGLGKTTLLRDIIRAVSDGDGVTPMRVGIADERGELAAMYDGLPQLDVGRRTDVLDGCPKGTALLMLLRGMNPQVLAADEITAPADCAALEAAANCGVTLLATAHASGTEDLSSRPLYRRLLDAGIFRRVVLIRGSGRSRTYQVKRLEGGVAC